MRPRALEGGGRITGPVAAECAPQCEVHRKERTECSDDLEIAGLFVKGQACGITPVVRDQHQNQNAQHVRQERDRQNAQQQCRVDRTASMAGEVHVDESYSGQGHHGVETGTGIGDEQTIGAYAEHHPVARDGVAGPVQSVVDDPRHELLQRQ